MDFAQQQRNPTKHIVGMAFVVLLHIGIIYGLLHGLARKVVEVIQQPLETKIIEEVKPPPVELPPPPPQPKMVAPPPPFIPPPEVQIQQPPPPQQNVITAVTATPPPADAPAPVAPRPAEVPSTPAPAPALSVAASCPNVRMVAGQMTYPGKAVKDGIKSAEVVVQFVMGPNGEIKNPTVLKTTNRMFNSAALEGVNLLKCTGQGRDIPIQWEISFKLPE